VAKRFGSFHSRHWAFCDGTNLLIGFNGENHSAWAYLYNWYHLRSIPDCIHTCNSWRVSRSTGKV